MQTTIDLNRALSDLAADLRERIPDAIESHTERLREEVPDYFVREDDPDFVELYEQSYRHQLRFFYDGLEQGGVTDDLEPPPIAAEEARAAVAVGIELDALVRAYRVCHRLIFEEVLDWAELHVEDPDVRAAVLRVASQWMFAYFDRLTTQITQAYESERDLLIRDREQRKRRLVRNLLDGQPVDPGQLEYELDRDHLGVIAWGDEPERVLSDLHRATGLALFAVAGTETTAWGWLAAHQIGAKELRLVRAFHPPPGAYLGVGEVGRGIDGFRLSHRQAWNAYRLARTGSESVTWYHDVALLALTLQEPRLAREFVSRELGPLAADDERSELLRETLVAYFAHGDNAAAAAAALGVHDRTVLYRVRSIEDRLGRPLTARREELGVALRLAPVALSAGRGSAQRGGGQRDDQSD